jgi:predicted ribosomally synthesized peptide with SipW-like signal peptide
MTKYKKAAVGIAAGIAAAAAGVTYAWLTAQDQVVNTLHVAKVETTVEETFTPPKHPGPGTVIPKSPWIHSSSNVDCYVRTRIVFTNDGAALCEPLAIRDGWVLAEDGYYYWKEPLAPGADTAPLFDTVKLREDLEESELWPFDLLVYSESVQAKGMEAEQAWACLDAH